MSESASGRSASSSVNRCEWCAKKVAHGVTECDDCGGPVRLLAPWVVQCGWCDWSNRRDETGVCTNCGGPLPSIPGGHPGPPPPSIPRALPKGYSRRIKWSKNVFTIIGVVFTLGFFWTVLFPIIGIPMWIYGHRRAKRILAALELGLPTGGEITGVEYDTSTKINGRSPWQISFVFETPQGSRSGRIEAWDPVHRSRPNGEHVWVVYLPADPKAYALWPPVR